MRPYVAEVALAAFVPITYLLVSRKGPSSGVQLALLAGWLFLPNYGGRIPVPYLNSKAAFVATTVLAVSLLSDWDRWSRLRLRSLDLFAAVLTLAPFVTAMANDLDAREGLAASVDAFSVWGAPYLLGRAYLRSPRDIRAFAVRLVGAALIYVPLCWWEIRMSPQLHRQVYGFAVGSFAQSVRFGGYRPTVFMSHGLMVGTFMATGTLIAYWLWRTGAVRRIWQIPISWCVLVLAVTTVAVKSTGAIALLAVGIVVLEATRRTRSPWLVVALSLVPVAFGVARASGWKGREIVDVASSFDSDRAASVAFRARNEDLLLDKALQRPWLGWGRFGRSRVYDEDGTDFVVTDSLWIITLGTSGLVGLGAMGVVLLGSVLLFLYRGKAGAWARPELAPAAVLAVSVLLWVVDSLLNSMVSPVFVAISGGLVTIGADVGRARVGVRRAPERPRKHPRPRGLHGSDGLEEHARPQS